LYVRYKGQISGFRLGREQNGKIGKDREAARGD